MSISMYLDSNKMDEVSEESEIMAQEKTEQINQPQQDLARTLERIENKIGSNAMAIHYAFRDTSDKDAIIKALRDRISSLEQEAKLLKFHLRLYKNVRQVVMNLLQNVVGPLQHKKAKVIKTEQH